MCGIELNIAFFKIGQLEGNILLGLVQGKSKEDIVKEEGITIENYNCITEAFVSNGVIGVEKKEKINPLYIKIPLIDINDWLEKICIWLDKHRYISGTIAGSFAICILFGIVEIIFNGYEIFNLGNVKLPIYQYICAYVLQMLIIFCHELGHGFVCKKMGGKVGKIGVAFIVFNPAMYCDISDVRMMKEKHKQIMTSMAGFIVNGIFIGIFSIAYCFSNDKFFAAMIIVNVTSVLINAIPLIRLDGYWVLSFALNVHNLYQKSIEQIKYIGKREKFRNWKDYFILLYGILNCALVLYCGVRFIKTAVFFVIGLFG